MDRLKVLAVRTHAFGDALMCTPAVMALTRHHTVDVMTGPSALPVWSRMPGINSLVPVNLPGNPISMLFRPRLPGYDMVVFFGFSPVMRRWLRWMTGSPVRSGGDDSLGSWETALGFSVRPFAGAYARIAGVEPDDLRPVFPLNPEETGEAASLTGPDRYAVLAPGGGRNPRQDVPEKRWSPEKWREVACYLRGKGLRVLAVGGILDREAARAVEADADLTGKCSWGLTAALIGGAEVFAGNDSGPAHLAVALRVPAVVVFGPTDPEALYPAGTILPVRTEASCSPCYAGAVFPGCGLNRRCVDSVEPCRVIETLEEVLS